MLSFIWRFPTSHYWIWDVFWTRRDWAQVSHCQPVSLFNLVSNHIGFWQYFTLYLFGLASFVTSNLQNKSSHRMNNHIEFRCADWFMPNNENNIQMSIITNRYLSAIICKTKPFTDCYWHVMEPIPRKTAEYLIG